jgi:2-haloacid dehalogenase
MLLIFDVNETLLDLTPLDDVVASVLSATTAGADPRRAWFDRMIRTALALTAAGEYVPFGTLAASTLRDLAAETDGRVDDGQVAALADGIRRLPAHPDVAPALASLRADGHRIVTLTNSVLEVAHDQLGASGLDDLVDAVYSADEVRRLKPAPEPYRMVLEREQTESGTLVAAHDWDVAGAAAAGLETVFVGREGRRPISAVAPPTHVVPDLSELPGVLGTPN